MAMKIVFMGTPDFSADVLSALVAAGHDVVAAYSQPPRAGGRRGKALTPSPVQARAEGLGIPVFTPKTLRDVEAQAEFAALGADIGVVFAYGLILPPAVLDAPEHGCLNIHASLLPRWRGAAPIQRAILAGDTETGVGIMQMEAGLDTGPVRAEARTATGGKTAGELTAELSATGARLLIEVLTDLDAFPPLPQPDEGTTYAAKIDKAEARIDWSRSAVGIERQVLAFNPTPGAFFEFGGERIKILAAEVFPGERLGPTLGGSQLDPGLRRGTVEDEALTIACGTGAIRPTLLQRAGRGVMTSGEFLRGFPIPPGTSLA
jgi:methionyl-tRNA formyltransferase